MNGGAEVATPFLLTLEGLNGTGKTSLAKSLGAHLQAPVLACPPYFASAARAAFDGSPFSSATQLFYLSWVLWLSESITHIHDEPIIICDRYLDSTLSYCAGAAHDIAVDLDHLSIYPPSATALIQCQESKRRARLESRGSLRPMELATCDPNFRRRFEAYFSNSGNQLIRLDSTHKSVASLTEEVVTSLLQLPSFPAGNLRVKDLDD